MGCMFCMCGKGVKGVCFVVLGDLIVKFVVEILVNLSVCQKELLKEFEEFCGGEVVMKYKLKVEGFFNGVKKFFDDLIS